jgi:2-isopropylmalate synthase
VKQINFSKYRQFATINLIDRQWPGKTITRAPIWCSVDLRDGNQALRMPMNLEEKLRMFNLLAAIGFKEIEIGFPSAAKVEYEFTRRLIEENRIPEDVTIQVLVQAREKLVQTTFDALKGAKKAIVHLYNSTSTLQREVVFKMNKEGVRDIAVDGARMLKAFKKESGNPGIRFEYSPESFTGTELDYALDVCHAVMDVLDPSPDEKLILNLPATVEMATPNVYADQIEWFCRGVKKRDSVIISLHTHNDRGTAVAAAELAVMAGADRVEGTLFGNGERTGNMDIVTMALNLFSQGIDPNLDLSNINRVREVYESCSKMTVHERHPYVGELVYTAFSGSHQDAINKGMKAQRTNKNGIWAVPYLPIDPRDVGRTYEKIVRINSQSGKGGVAYIMEQAYGFKLPKAMHPDFGQVIQAITDRTGKELTPKELLSAFEKEYLMRSYPYHLRECNIRSYENEKDGAGGHTTAVSAVVSIDGTELKFESSGNGPIDAFVKGFKEEARMEFALDTYDEHAIGVGSDSKAVAYVSIQRELGRSCFGAGVDANISIASIKAVLSALNRLELPDSVSDSAATSVEALK